MSGYDGRPATQHRLTEGYLDDVEQARVEERLQDVPWLLVDDGIEPLVAAVNLYAETTMSCEGHHDHGEPYPWVDVSREQPVEQLQDAVDRFNDEADILWDVGLSTGSTDRLAPEPAITHVERPAGMVQQGRSFEAHEYDLEELQRSADRLASFLREQSAYSALVED